MEIKIKKLDKNAVIPSYAKPGDACCDVTAIDYEYDAEHDLHVYHTGLAFEIPEGYCLKIYPRSSNTKTECYLPNSVGNLDAGYRGELLVKYKARGLTSLQDQICGVWKKPYNVGDRVAQIQVMPYPKMEFVVVDELSKTERGEGGFGHTGK
jgi:dUTP pyrophosphatase